MFVLGATGPVDASLRRPWIDWIHTSADQAGIIRDFIKWDNQPSSADALVEAMARANIMTRSEPKAPVYICLDAGLQESTLEKQPEWPDLNRLKPPAPPRAAKADLDAAVKLLKDAKRPVVLMGKTDWTDEGWQARIKLVERLGAVVFTDLKNRSSFPTDHPCHVAAPFNQVGRAPKRIIEILEQADVVLALEWIDLASALRIKKGQKISAKVIATGMDQYLHNGAHANYQALPESDIFMAAAADSVIADLNAELGAGKKDCWQQAQRKDVAIDSTRVTMDQLAVSLRAAFDNPDKVSLAAICRGWTADLWPFRHPRAYLGKDGGGGIGSGPALAVGAAVGNAGTDLHTVAILGDGDFAMGGHAIWTAARHRIPLLVLINNNRSYFNDELHQETVARRRNRPVGNRWIGQRLSEPEVDIAGLCNSYGGVGIGPVRSVSELEAAIKKGVEALNAGKVCVIDCHVNPGEERSARSTIEDRKTD
jgi:thiamine pyrophosphate-dependent acetolactate synthase large subunit-like protein